MRHESMSINSNWNKMEMNVSLLNIITFDHNNDDNDHHDHHNDKVTFSGKCIYHYEQKRKRKRNRIRKRTNENCLRENFSTMIGCGDDNGSDGGAWFDRSNMCRHRSMRILDKKTQSRTVEGDDDDDNDDDDDDDQIDRIGPKYCDMLNIYVCNDCCDDEQRIGINDCNQTCGDDANGDVMSDHHQIGSTKCDRTRCVNVFSLNAIGMGLNASNSSISLLSFLSNGHNRMSINRQTSLPFVRLLLNSTIIERWRTCSIPYLWETSTCKRRQDSSSMTTTTTQCAPMSNRSPPTTSNASSSSNGQPLIPFLSSNISILYKRILFITLLLLLYSMLSSSSTSIGSTFQHQNFFLISGVDAVKSKSILHFILFFIVIVYQRWYLLLCRISLFSLILLFYSIGKEGNCKSYYSMIGNIQQHEIDR